MVKTVISATRAVVALAAVSCLIGAGCSAAAPRGRATRPGEALSHLTRGHPRVSHLPGHGITHRAGGSVAAPAVVGGSRAGTPRRASTDPGATRHTTRRRPCRANRGQLVRVSLRLQHLWMCSGRHQVLDTPITSGMAGRYTSTPTGTFSIQGFNRNSVLTLNTGAQYDVKYWIPFQAPLYGFHDASWQHFPYGSPKYRKHGSHGCVHMPLRAIAFLYRWAHVGTKVSIRR